MHIGVIVHSQTGNTLSVAEKLASRLREGGHEVSVERVTDTGGSAPAGEVGGGRPEVSGYDAVVFGAPVHSFGLSKEMKAFMGGMGSLEGKAVACFTTKGLPGKGTGGSRAVREMSRLAEAKGGSVAATGVVVWRGAKERMTEETVGRIAEAFKAA